MSVCGGTARSRGQRLFRSEFESSVTPRTTFRSLYTSAPFLMRAFVPRAPNCVVPARMFVLLLDEHLGWCVVRPPFPVSASPFLPSLFLLFTMSFLIFSCVQKALEVSAQGARWDMRCFFPRQFVVATHLLVRLSRPLYLSVLLVARASLCLSGPLGGVASTLSGLTFVAVCVLLGAWGDYRGRGIEKRTKSGGRDICRCSA